MHAYVYASLFGSTLGAIMLGIGKVHAVESSSSSCTAFLRDLAAEPHASNRAH
eukprot:CAMPEP_0119362372 /NCGR_PEP_ID=MMETSP1334-20130426/9456_1 /TAXON_ID=127549 /ORGANISM="Calcidiscus leptoporus, Strain RCC1130" /LENGTH=52 /DNA_ID=CAMNT_0007377581 /DNA_START=114 /DNA_END=272 /DNA_ORIENTATION=+